jgi:hypothetical protein
MSFSQMTTAAFSSGRKNVEELLATPGDLGTGATSESNQGRTRVARTIGLRRLPPEANSRPQSHISRSPAKPRRRHRRNRFLLIFYPFLSSRRFLLQSAVLRPLTVPFPMALISLRRPHRWLIIRRRDLARSIPISTSSNKIRAESDNKRCA